MTQESQYEISIHYVHRIQTELIVEHVGFLIEHKTLRNIYASLRRDVNASIACIILFDLVLLLVAGVNCNGALFQIISGYLPVAVAALHSWTPGVSDRRGADGRSHPLDREI